MVRLVSTPTIRLGLEISLRQEPIEGVLRDERGTEQPFTGWLALMERLDALRSEQERSSG
jgi:hypothetical protein